jgi:hypothetical protein
MTTDAVLLRGDDIPQGDDELVKIVVSSASAVDESVLRTTPLSRPPPPFTSLPVLDEGEAPILHASSYLLKGAVVCATEDG